MPRPRTLFAALAVGGTVLAGGAALATSATAAPVPVAAVTALTTADAAPAPSDAAPGGREQRHGPAGARHWWSGLTDAQRQCLEDAKITRPVGPLDDAQREALRTQVSAAADACGVELPMPKARAFWNDLTDTQRQCLQDAVQRPWGPMTTEQRQQVRSDLQKAAATCGVELPERPQRGQRPAPSATPSS